MSKETVIRAKAMDLLSGLQDACGDIGYEEARSSFDDGSEEKVKKLKKQGVIDIGGRLADDYYNDVGFLTDIIGDRVYGDPDRTEILKTLGIDGHTALGVAVEKLLDR